MNREYFLKSKIKWLYALTLVGSLFFSGFSVAVAFTPAFIYLVLGLSTLYDALFSRILLTDDHIEYISLGYKTGAKWVDLKEIGYLTSSNTFGIEGVYLNDKKTLRNKLGIMDKNFIPISWFAENWRDSELGQQIKQHAPHLFK